jgi:hypothetical protein
MNGRMKAGIEPAKHRQGSILQLSDSDSDPGPTVVDAFHKHDGSVASAKVTICASWSAACCLQPVCTRHDMVVIQLTQQRVLLRRGHTGQNRHRQVASCPSTHTMRDTTRYSQQPAH